MSIVFLACLASLAPVAGCSAPAARRDPASVHRRDSGFVAETRQANRRLLGWLEGKRRWAGDLVAARGAPGGPPDAVDFHLADEGDALLPAPTDEEARTARETKALVDEYFPPQDPSSHLGTFFECGNPWILTERGPYQWDSLRASGVRDPKVFEAVVRGLVGQGIKNIRLGPNLFDLDPADPAKWEPYLAMIETIWRAGGTPTVSVAFFPSLAAWVTTDRDGAVDYGRSYLLHPDWPSDMGRITERFLARLWPRAAALGTSPRLLINPFNEPETLAGFNRQFWHGAFAPWDHPETLRYYVPSILQIAKANVLIRLAAERASPGRRLLFVHNEAMTPDYYPSHRGLGRFATSKFMLGDRQVLETDFDAYVREPLGAQRARLAAGAEARRLRELDWAFHAFAFGAWNGTDAERENARQRLAGEFKELQDLHLRLREQTGKTMKTDTMLALDYYYQTEFRLRPGQGAADLVAALSADRGERLRQVLSAPDDATFLAMLRRAAGNAEGDLPPEGPKGPRVAFPFLSRGEIDFARLLTQDDSVMLERLVGLRRNYLPGKEPEFVERRLRAGLRLEKEKLYRTDGLMAQLLAGDGAPLRRVLGVTDAESLRARIAAIAADTRDGGPPVPMAPRDTVAQVLDREGRAVLHRMLGLEREWWLGFEPQHYARHLRLGVRDGFHRMFLDYVRELGVRVAGVGESGTPFYVFAPMLHDQMLMDFASALKAGVFGAPYAVGPAIDTVGWAKKPLGLHYEDDHDVSPCGIYRLDGKGGVKLRGNEAEGKPWLPQFIGPLFESLRTFPP